MPQAATPPDGYQQIFADQLHRVTDQPHKVNYKPHEVTDRPHQTRLGAFRFFDTNNMSYFTHQSNGSLMPNRP